MVAALISDDLWNLIAPLLPPLRSKPKGRRPRVPDRASAAPIATIPSKPSRLLTLFLTCRANEGGHAIALPAYLAIAVMTRKQSGKVYECVELTPDSRSETLNMAVAWVGIAG